MFAIYLKYRSTVTSCLLLLSFVEVLASISSCERCAYYYSRKRRPLAVLQDNVRQAANYWLENPRPAVSSMLIKITLEQ